MEKREKSSSIIFVIFFIPFFIWAALQFITPLAVESNTITDLTGLTGVSDNENIINEIPQPWASVYNFGDKMCHQKADRSFFINGNQMPFCSRCTAIWLGLAIGVGFLIFYKIRLDEKFLFLIIIGIIPIGIDGLGQLFNFWESSNFMRVITGLLIGTVCGIAIGLIIDEIRDFVSSSRKEQEPVDKR